MSNWNPTIGAQGDHTPVYRHPVLGFRGWEVHRPTDGSPTRLRSPHISSCVWDGPEMKAECLEWGESGKRKHRHRVPHATDSCGLYGYYDLFSDYVHGPVKGAVAATGRCQVHSEGFRAEKVRILALALPLPVADMPLGELEAQEQVIREIAAFYGVPAVEPADLESFAAEHATHVPQNLRPEHKTRPEPPPAGISIFDPAALVTLASLCAAFGIALVGGVWRLRRG